MPLRGAIIAGGHRRPLFRLSPNPPLRSPPLYRWPGRGWYNEGMETTEPRTRGGWELSAPSEPKGALRRTPRVLGLLYELFDNEWMHSGHLKALDAGEKTDRLLLRMAQHHLVARLTLDWGWKAPPVGGQPPQLYELAPLGAYDLAAAGMISAEQLREWERERAKREAARADDPNVKYPLLRHQIANADVTVWFHQACLAHGYRLERGYQLATGSNPRVLALPDRARPLITDDTYRIETGGRRAIVWIETDRDTEPYARRDKRELKSIERMLKGYLAYARSGLVRAQFGVEDFYQLTITTGGASRVEGIAGRACAVGCAAEFRDRFLVTNFDALALASPFAAPWMNAAGSIGPLAL